MHAERFNRDPAPRASHLPCLESVEGPRRFTMLQSRSEDVVPCTYKNPYIQESSVDGQP